MRRVAALLLTLAGCSLDLVPPEHEIRGWKKDELEAGPGNNELKAAIVNDVRRWRYLDQHLQDGVSTCLAFKVAGDKTVCSSDESEISVFDLRKDLADQVHRVEETAYFCPKEGVYYYHYEGGPRKLDVWLGPYPISRPGKKLDDYK